MTIRKTLSRRNTLFTFLYIRININFIPASSETWALFEIYGIIFIMNLRTNIVLIGMPAVGKSTVGKILSETLSYDFLDTDDFILEKEKRSLHDIISEKGLKEFCRIEESHVSSIDVRHTVISTGGSVVYGPCAMAHLSANGFIVYLAAGLSVLKGRIGDLEERGVVLKPNQTLDSLFNERDRLYRHYADTMVHCPDGDTPEITAARVLRMLPFPPQEPPSPPV